MPAQDRDVRRSARRIAIVTGSVLVALVVLLSVVFAFLDQDAVARRVADYMLPRVSDNLGRQVTIEGVRAKLLPNPHVFLTRLTVHGEGNEPPLVEADEMEVDLALWPLITSLGKDVRVDSVRLHRPELNLLRNKEGTWNFENLGSKAPSQREVLVSKVRIDGGTVRIIDRSTSHGEATVALTKLDAVASNIGAGKPLALTARAAFASDAQNVRADLSLSELPKKLEGLTKFPSVKGMLSITNGSLARLEGFLPARLGKLLTGGEFNLDLEVATAKDGYYVVNGTGALRELQLRGQPANGSLKLAARIDPNDPKTTRLDVTNLALNGPGIDLGGTAALTAQPMRVEFALAGKRLDLQTLLGAMPESEQAPQQRTTALPNQMRKTIEDISAVGSLKIAEVVSGKLTARNLDAHAVLEGGMLTLDRGRAEVYAGTADASGTSVNLLKALPKWNLKARLEQVNLADAMAAVSGHSVLEGQVDAALNVVGEGADWAQLRQNLTGAGTMALADGALTSTDLSDRIAGALSQGLQMLGKGGAAKTVEKTTGKTQLKDLRGSFDVKDGWMVLREPLEFTSSMGTVAVDGRIGLDQQLDLKGHVMLSKDFLAKVSPRGLTPSGASVPLRIGGTLKDPKIQTEPVAMAEALVSGVRGQEKKIESEVERQARKKLGGALEHLGGGNK